MNSSSTIGDTHLRELESLVLRIVKTKGNKQKGKFIKSEDLRPHFTRDAKRSWQLEMQEMLGLSARSRPKVQPAIPDGRAPVLAAYIDGPLKLRARSKGETLHATVARTGTIRFNSKVYTSPSLAGAAAVKRSTCNGWTFWRYERAPGDWVLLNELRK